MYKERQTMKVIAQALCLCLLLGTFAFGNPQEAYGWTPSQTEKNKTLMEIKSEAKVDSSWDQDGMYDKNFYDEIISNYADSYGSKGDPLKIGTASQLAAFAKVVNENPTYDFRGKYVELAEDINLDGGKLNIESYNGTLSAYEIIIRGSYDNVWQPIGIDPDHPFRGTFDGNNREIKGMVVLNELTEANVYSGFFGVLDQGGTIQNLRITDGNVLSAVNYRDEQAQDGFSAYAGGLVGQNNGSITNSDSTGDVASITKRASNTLVPLTSAYAGGLVGWNGKTGRITESHGMGTAMSYSFSRNSQYSSAGGLAGWNEGRITVSFSTGYVLTCGDAPNHAGGLVGTNGKGAEIETSHSTGAMIASYNRSQFVSSAGGMVGWNNGRITASYSTGDVKSAAKNNSSFAGGLVGYNGENGSIAESWSTGATTSVGASSRIANPVYAGGLAGWNEGVITASYSTGEVRSSAKKSSAYAGGLVGKNGEYGRITESYTAGVAKSSVDSNDSVPVFAGGLVGENDQNAGTVKHNYWDNTEEPTAAGGSEKKIEDEGTALDRRKMTGMGPGRAETTMDGFDESIWEFEADSNITGDTGAPDCHQTWYYPRLTAITYTDESPKPKYIKTGPRLSDYTSMEITGTPEVGKTLTAETKGVPGGAPHQYQWYVEGVGNKGTEKTYVVEEEDAGKEVIATVFKEDYVGTLEASVKIPCSVEIKNPQESHIRWISGEASQRGITGAMEDVVFEAESGYYFPENYRVDAVNGVEVKRDSYTQITVSGTPTANTNLTLKPATKKADQSPPSAISDGVRKISGTDKNMEYAASLGDAANWITCDEGTTTVEPGTWYVRYKETDTKNASAAFKLVVTSGSSVPSVPSTPSVSYTVTIVNPTDGHMTRSVDAGNGSDKQNVYYTKSMKPVVYEAEKGYYFPEDYSVDAVNGIQVKRDSYTQITVSGMPTANVSVLLKPAVEKAAQNAPSKLKNGESRILGTTDSMEYAASSNAEKWSACKNGSTAVKAGTWFVRYKETATKKAGAAAKITVAPKIKVTTTYNSARISWKKVSGAAGYQVYRATSQNGKYKKVRTTAKTSWKNEKLTTGKVYYYKVRAYKKSGSKTVYGSFSIKAKAVPRTKAPTFKLTAGKNKIQVSWNKVSGADGYRIYRAKSKNGSYKMIKDSRSKLRRYTSVRLTGNHKYYYKMRSYRVVKGKKVYSEYSGIKSKQTR